MPERSVEESCGDLRGSLQTFHSIKWLENTAAAAAAAATTTTITFSMSLTGQFFGITPD